MPAGAQLKWVIVYDGVDNSSRRTVANTQDLTSVLPNIRSMKLGIDCLVGSVRAKLSHMEKAFIQSPTC